MPRSTGTVVCVTDSDSLGDGSVSVRLLRAYDASV